MNCTGALDGQPFAPFALPLSLITICCVAAVKSPACPFVGLLSSRALA
jgi:hypothetical protein